MRRILSLLILVVLSWSFFDDVVIAQQSETAPQEKETTVIDLTADVVYPVTLNDTVEVMCLVGNFAAQHNGAVITADSAVRYNDKRLECFGNVLINKNTTYAYADRADYNGEKNEANLYAPIIKVVDGDATLYCYNFSFNTLDNIGSYVGGGVMINGESVMESVTGYYYSDAKELIGVGEVQLSGDEYEMISDSVIYNTETENAFYYNNTNIWNQKDEYLYADEGDYDKVADRYTFTLNGYILTDEQEIWSDSLDYFRATEHIYMRHNIQIDDTTHKSLIFGDYGEYIKTPGDMVLYGRPSIINYDAEQGEGDSLYMCADTFRIFTLNRFETSDSTTIVAATEMAAQQKAQMVAPAVDSLEHSHDHDHAEDHVHAPKDKHAHEDRHEHAPKERPEQKKLATPAGGMIQPGAPQPNGGPRVDVGSQGVRGQHADSIVHRDTLARHGSDSLASDSLSVDSLQVDSLALDSMARAADTLNFWQRIVSNYRKYKLDREVERRKEKAARKIILDSIGLERQKVINAKLDAEKVREARRIAARRVKLAERKARKLRRDVKRGKISAADTAAMMSDLAVDTAALIDEIAPKRQVDSLLADTLAVDSLALDSLSLDSLSVEEPVDSLYRLTKGYRNVKIYRTDFQAVADSMVTSSIDSIIRLYINPVLWHDNNQVTSEVMDIYTANNTIDKAIFTGGMPIMASELEKGKYYNQISGKVITSLFAEGTVYRTDAEGNSQTIYFMQDDETQEVNGMLVMESASATFYIEDQTVVGITYRVEPIYTLYPLNLVPSDQAYTLKGFEWQEDRRPEREEVFDRTIRPTIREEKSALSRPEFPIQHELDDHRKELIESGGWIERDEPVAPYAQVWMESLGFQTGQPREEQK